MCRLNKKQIFEHYNQEVQHSVNTIFASIPTQNNEGCESPVLQMTSFLNPYDEDVERFLTFNKDNLTILSLNTDSLHAKQRKRAEKRYGLIYEVRFLSRFLDVGSAYRARAKKGAMHTAAARRARRRVRPVKVTDYCKSRTVSLRPRSRWDVSGEGIWLIRKSQSCDNHWRKHASEITLWTWASICGTTKGIWSC